MVPGVIQTLAAGPWAPDPPDKCGLLHTGRSGGG